MKKLILILLLSVSVNAQGWNSVITTSINISNVEYFENHADKNGIHFVTYDYNGQIIYYLIGSNGSAIRNSTISANGTYPNIVGNADAVFVVYREGSNIRIKKSTDAGANWSQPFDYSIGSNPCSGVDAEINDAGIHIVWSIGDSYGQEMEVNYIKLRLSDNEWVYFYNVTNYPEGYGTNPTVTLSPDRVHVGYNSYAFMPDTYYAYDEDEMSRTKYDDDWETQQIISAGESGRGKIFAGSDKIYDFFYDFVGGMGQFHSDLYFKSRDYGSAYWSASALLESFSDVTIPLVFCETANENIYTYTASDEVKERVIINGSAGSPVQISSGGGIWGLCATAAYNDRYLAWKRGSNNYLEYRQYNAVPQTPQNLYATVGIGNHPRINWVKNNEPDIQAYRVYKRDQPNSGTWYYLGSTTNNYYDDNSEIIVIGSHIANEINKYYCVKSVDLNNLYSDFSNTLEIRVEGNAQLKLAYNDNAISSYSVFSNYPNPFNPSTKIKFALPVSAVVTVRVFNAIGEEVAVLGNREYSQGIHEEVFGAESVSGSLTSGVYFYTIDARGSDGTTFRSVNKMMLLK